MELADVKLYLRVDGNEEDNLIQTLITSAQKYIKDVTGKDFDDSEADNSLYDLAVKLLVSHWYCNRSPVSDKPVNNLPNSLDMLVQHLSLCSAYE